MLLSLDNGQIFDCNLGYVRDRQQHDYFTYCFPVQFSISDINIREELNELIDDMNNMLTLLGYCFTGETNETRIILLDGCENSGLDLLLELLMSVINQND